MTEAIVGFLTGVVASMGLGGGFILMIWLMIFADMPQKTAQGVNLVFFLPIALLSLIMHIKGGLVNKSLVKKYIFGGIAGAILGTLASQIVAGELLRKLYAIFLLAFGIKELLCSDRQESRNHNNQTEQ